MTCTQRFFQKEYDRLQDICRMYVGTELGDDLMQDLCIMVLGDKPDKFDDICQRGELWYYLVRTIKINAFSKTTPFYTKYKKHHDYIDKNWYGIEHKLPDTHETYDDNTDQWTQERLGTIQLVLKDIPWFEAELFKIYYLHEHTLQSLSDATGINKNTINKGISRAKRKVRRHLKEKGEAYEKEGHKKEPWFG
ncbi:MAG: hypothetical protein CMI60_11310 [Parvibaculum sp.]|nr:hypothetical protein [Parvibaculum sp.]